MATDRRLVFRHKGDVKMVLDPQGNLLVKGDVRSPTDGHSGLVFRSSERPDPCASIKSHRDLAHDGVLVAAAVAERVEKLPSEDRPSLRFARWRDVKMELAYLGRGDRPGGEPRLRGDLLRNFATRKNVGKMKPVERDNLRDAFIALQHRAYPGSRSDPIPGGVTYWFKQDEIHEATHVHAFPPYRGIAFLPWHRELVNRLEALLREVDPTVSLHYWDWQTDPRNSHGVDLMTPAFMGASNGPAGEPWLSAGYYVPAADPHRDASGRPFDPPRLITRQMSEGAPGIPSDVTIISDDAYPDMREDLEDAHGFGPRVRGRDDRQRPHVVPRPVRLPPALKRRSPLGELAAQAGESMAVRPRASVWRRVQHRRGSRGGHLRPRHPDPTGPVGGQPEQPSQCSEDKALGTTGERTSQQEFQTPLCGGAAVVRRIRIVF